MCVFWPPRKQPRIGPLCMPERLCASLRDSRARAAISARGPRRECGVAESAVSRVSMCGACARVCLCARARVLSFYYKTAFAKSENLTRGVPPV